MRLLIIGGTIFLGRHLVEAARAAGHQVTVFHRGRHEAPLPAEVERVLGDRDGGLDALAGGTWDAVVDTCGYAPRVVRASAELLADACEHYTFVSSISVYASPFPTGADEHAPLGRLDDPSTEQVTGETYGPLKALCEQAAEDAMPGRVLNVRPGLIVGPYDLTERYTYWPRRIARGGEMLAPGDGSAPVQLIDARDLAAWIVRCAEQRITGTYNTTGPDEPMRFDEFLAPQIGALGSDARPVWIDEAFLAGHQVQPWTELPLWIPSDDEDANLNRVDCARAIADGLTFRSLEDIARDTLTWDRLRPEEAKGGASLTAEKEQAVLDAWVDRVGTVSDG